MTKQLSVAAEGGGGGVGVWWCWLGGRGGSVAKRVGGHILSMSNRLVNNHCQQEHTKDQKSAIVI